MNQRRLAAAGGIVGPAGFIAAWSILGATADNYDPVQDAISRLAAIGAPTRPGMTAGFVVFGVGLPIYAAALRQELEGPAWKAAAATGIATLGVAALPLDHSATIDLAHGAAATIGYVTLAAVPWLAARPLEKRNQRTYGAISRIAAVASAVALAATVLGPSHGFFQRLGLTIGDIWIVTNAIRLMRRD